MGNQKKSSNSGEDLHTAARSGDLTAVQSLCCSNPLAVNSRDKHSRTPLHLAAWSGQAQVVSYLCKNRADVGASAMDDMGAIHFAAQKGHLEVVRILLSSGVSVKAINRKGMTALHYAVQGSHLELVKYLIKKGAKLHAKNKAGKTPLDLVSSEEVRSFFLECEKMSDGGGLNGKEKAEEALPIPLSEEKAEGSDCEVVVGQEEEAEQRKDESVKRKGDGEVIKENLSEPKKAKVTLNHLAVADDTLEEEENV